MGVIPRIDQHCGASWSGYNLGLFFLSPLFLPRTARKKGKRRKEKDGGQNFFHFVFTILSLRSFLLFYLFKKEKEGTMTERPFLSLFLSREKRGKKGRILWHTCRLIKKEKVTH